MDKNNKQMLLGLGFTGAYGANAKAWKSEGVTGHIYPDIEADIRYAQLAEKGKFQFLFIGDFPGAIPNDNSEVPSMTLEPIITATAILQRTKNIGIAATVHTQWNVPYTVARQFKGIDLMSGGRIAWNAVTGSSPKVAQLFGVNLMDRQSRYESHYEFVEAVQQFWATWGEDALKADRETGVFADYRQVKPVYISGKYTQANGALPIPPSSQGQPVIFHSGGSPASIAFAGRYANAMIGEVWTIEQGIETRKALRQAAIDAGRNPDEIKFIAGLMPVIADSKREAIDRHATFMDEKVVQQRVYHIGMVLGLRLTPADLDRPIAPELLNSVEIDSYSDPRIENVLKVAHEGWTLRDIIYHSVIDYHPATLGDAKETADHLTTWFEAGAADGFWILPDAYETDLHRFVNEVVPILQERGIFHKEYEGETLRKNLDVPYQYGVDERLR
ncbi:LLM class flavin-dependent oxidoreductase [Macrococcus hajekii]|uniref:LLM class flavin-dependent oxidoreductase n=1 Tax=Macrococcus hajekii TaxID=198482 RepID=A0A4R6BK62_9STAP|nr:NtaA/DmoA family FMN-dependent monooxygenase [Macrococcus hajekii]TDM02006.1 LLM class flavin-dependent oxidoreductase [Macrococcus hajekii]GGB09245.1 nitrilotriacetate monooxygenase [Macrococcus hajekii]